MSEKEKPRPRTKTELRRGAGWTGSGSSGSVTADEEALLLGEDGVRNLTACEDERRPARHAEGADLNAAADDVAK